LSGFVSSLSNKQERFFQNPTDVIVSDRVYNMVIGIVIAYGVLVNMVMVKYLSPVFVNMNPLLLFIGYIVLCLAGTFIAYRSDNPYMSFLGYNLVVVPIGAVLAVCLQGYDSSLVFEAFVLTSVVTVFMLGAATAFPGTFAGMGRMLFMALMGLLIGQLVCMILHIYPSILAWISAGIFSLYIGYDWVRAQSYIKTLDHAVDSALDIYIDIINLFLQILRILGRRSE